MFSMRSISGPDAGKTLDLLGQLKHANILTVHALFSYDIEITVVYEDEEVCLEEFIIARPNEPQLAAIIAQVNRDVKLQQ